MHICSNNKYVITRENVVRQFQRNIIIKFTSTISKAGEKKKQIVCLLKLRLRTRSPRKRREENGKEKRKKETDSVLNIRR